MVTTDDFRRHMLTEWDGTSANAVATARMNHRQWIRDHCWTYAYVTEHPRSEVGDGMILIRNANVCCIQSISRLHLSGRSEVASITRPDPRLPWSVGTLYVKSVGSRGHPRTCIHLTPLTRTEFFSTYQGAYLIGQEHATAISDYATEAD